VQEVRTVKEISIGELPNGNLQLSVRTEPPHSAYEIRPEVAGQLLMTLIVAMGDSKNPELRRLTQLLAIREVSAQVEQGLATLSYELECGAELKSTLSADSCMALSAELSKATESPKRH
jgi:hypothetical protein